MKKTSVLLLSALAIAITGIVIAQEPPPPPPPPDAPGGPHLGPGLFSPQRGAGGERARELLEQVFVARLSRKLELNDEQAVLMVRRYSEHRERILHLKEQRRELAAQLRKRVEANPDNPEIGELLSRLEGIDRDIVNARFAIYEQLREGLSQAQRAALYLFIADFEEEMRGWLNQVQRRRFMGEPNPFMPGEMGPGEGPGRETGPPMRGEGRRPPLRGPGRGPVPPAMPNMPDAPPRPRIEEPPPPQR